MADYYPLIAKAVSGLDKSTGEARRALYDRARTALLGQLRGVEPALSEADITRERLSLEEAIRRVEAEAVRRSRGEPPPSRADYRPEPALRGEASADQPQEFSDLPLGYGSRATRPSLAAADEGADTDGARQAVSLSAAATARAPDSETRRTERWGPGGPSLSDDGLRSFRESIGDAGALEEGAVRTHHATSDRDESDRDLGRLEQSHDRWAEHGDAGIDHGVDDYVPPVPRLSSRDTARPPASFMDPDDGGNRALQSFPRIVRPERPQSAGLAPERPPLSAWGAPRNINRAVAVVVIGLLALGIGGVAFWFGDDIMSSIIRGSSSRIDPAAPPDTASHGNKIIERAPTAAENATAPQKVVLYEEDPTNPNGTQFVGTAVWRIERVPPGAGQAPDVVIRGDIEIPDQRISVRLSLGRNDDKQLPASHTVEIVFKLPPDFAHSGIANIPGIMVKQGETTRGIALNGVAVKVTDNFFLVGLSAADAEMQRNVQLLKERSWFDIPIVYADGKRALIAIEKGVPGERVFSEAFAAWERP
jgi:hypothetical protein